MSIIGGINLGNSSDYLFLFADGSIEVNWQGPKNGFIGDVAVDGIKAIEKTSGLVSYAGTIYTNDTTLGSFENITNQNVGQAIGSTRQIALVSSLESDLISAFHKINALPATPGYTSVSLNSLNGLNTKNGGAIVPLGGLIPSNFINVAGDIKPSGGGLNPSEPYPQGPRYKNGTGDLIAGGGDWKGGGFFTGYWLTTGSPD